MRSEVTPYPLLALVRMNLIITLYSIFLLLDVPLNCIHLEQGGLIGGKFFEERVLEKLVESPLSHQ